MSLLKCPKCGEMFSDSYKTCPFCEEDEAFANGGKKPVNPGRRVHRQKSPSILGPPRTPRRTWIPTPPLSP